MSIQVQSYPDVAAFLITVCAVRLSDEMYSKATHFLLEFIQNADDNEYAANVKPELSLKFESRRITIECNEIGFNEENVRAICKIGVSTKKGCSGYIGMTTLIISDTSGAYWCDCFSQAKRGLVSNYPLIVIILC